MLCVRDAITEIKIWRSTCLLGYRDTVACFRLTCAPRTFLDCTRERGVEWYSTCPLPFFFKFFLLGALGTDMQEEREPFAGAFVLLWFT